MEMASRSWEGSRSSAWWARAAAPGEAGSAASRSEAVLVIGRLPQALGNSHTVSTRLLSTKNVGRAIRGRVVHQNRPLAGQGSWVLGLDPGDQPLPDLALQVPGAGAVERAHERPQLHARAPGIGHLQPPRHPVPVLRL